MAEEPRETLAVLIDFAKELLSEDLEDSGQREIDAEDTLLSLGIDSFSAFYFQEKVRRHMGIGIPLEKLLANVPLIALARYLDSELAAGQLGEKMSQPFLVGKPHKDWEEGEV